MSHNSNPSSDSDHNEAARERAPPVSYPQPTQEKRRRRPSYVPPPQSENIRPRPTLQATVSQAVLKGKSDSMGSERNEQLVNTITAQVLAQLQASGALNTGQNGAAPTTEAAPAPPHQDIPPRNVITPPSPETHQLPRIDPTAHANNPSIDALRSPDTPDAPSSPRRPSARPASPPPKRETTSRPPPPERSETDDMTPLEKMWKILFSDNGKPTLRLDQFLRGLALQLIEGYEPQHSLVVTPEKLRRFYEETKLEQEIHPWKEIFGDRVKHTELSHIFRDLHCEHHFVQPSANEKPTMPALTPKGLATFMTIVILSNPELEHERMSKAVLNMAISNADERSERWPKEIPRRLFPQKPNIQARQDLDASIYAGALEGYRETARPQAQPTPAAQPPNHAPRPSSIPSQQVNRQTNAPRQSVPAPPPPVQAPPEKDAGYTSAGSSEAVEDEAPDPTIRPLERQRNPYHAQPGAGRVLDEQERKPRDSQRRNSRSESVPQRSNTFTGQRPSRPAEPAEALDEYGVNPRRSRVNSLAPNVPNNPRRRSGSRSSRTSGHYTRSGENITPGQPFLSHPSLVKEPSYDGEPLRPYASADTRRYRFPDDAPRDPRDPRDLRNSQDIRDPRDYDDHRRSYPPPPPPAYPNPPSGRG